MRNAKRKTILAGAVAAAASTMTLSQVHAAFTVTDTSTVSGSNTVYYLSALNTGGTTGTKLLAENITITTPGTGTAGAIQFQSVDVDGDGHADANLFGQGVTSTLGSPNAGTPPNIKTSTVGTFSRIGGYGTVLSAIPYDSLATTGTVPANYRTNPTGKTGSLVTTPTYAPTPLDSVFTTNSLHYLNYQLAQPIANAVADNSTPVVFADIVVPTGTPVTIAGLLAGDTGSPSAFTTLVLGGSTGSTSTTTGTNKIVSLLATGSNPAGTAPNGYGSAPLGTLSVTNAGGTGKYFPGYFNIPGGKSTGYVAVTGFLNNDYPEVYALQVQVGGATPTTAQINTIIGDISNSSSGVASVTTVAGSSYAGIFGGYQILITDTTVDPYFAFDFSNSGSDTTDGDTALGAVTVTSIAAVPEPATAAGLVLGAAGLLLGRRKNRAVVA